MLNIPRSLYGRRPPRGPGGPGGGGGMGRLAQMNPSMMARLMRRGQPAPQTAPQAYGGPPAPQVPFQGGQPPAAPTGAGQGAPGVPGGTPDMAMMGDALTKIFGGGGEPTGPGPQAAIGANQATAALFPGGGPQGGMDQEKIMGIMKMLPMLMGG